VAALRSRSNDLDTDGIAAHVARVFGGATDLPINGAFLFGSSLGQPRPDSDIDVALVPIGEPSLRAWEIQGDAERLLPPYLGHPFDVTVLGSGLFAFEVVRTGRLVFVRDEPAVWDFIAFVARRGPDLEYRHRRAVAEVLAGGRGRA